MKYVLQYWTKDDGNPNPEAIALEFNNLGQIVAYLQPVLPIELVDNHWTILVNMDTITENLGMFTIAHSQIEDDIDDLMANNPEYIRMGIPAIRNALKQLLE